MNIRIFFPVVFFIITGTYTLSGQEYAVPLETGNLQLSSSFGKLRNTRFHAGVDFRTGGVEGVKLYATKAGHIYRICVKPYGYGKGIYIAHNDGTISVYGHLRDFTPDVEEYVKKERYRKESGSIDIFPSPAQFPVSKGQLVGYSGNSGNSFGPHLHFEVRDAKTNRTRNVIARGYYKVADNIKPVIHSVSYYVVDTVRGVPFHTLAAKVAAVSRGNGRYELAAPVKAPGRGYFTVETHDRKNNTSFNMAAYRIRMDVDSVQRFEFIMDAFDYTQTRYAQTVAQYTDNLKSKYDVYRLAVQGDGGRLPFYGKVVNRGVIDPSRDKSINISVEDDNGNVSELGFTIEYAPFLYLDTISIPTGAVPVDYRREFRRTSDSLTVVIPANALYESIFYTHKRLPQAPQIDGAQNAVVLSDFYEVHNTDTPIHSSVKLSIRADVPEEMRPKLLLARVVPGKAPSKFVSAVKASYKDGVATANVSSFGVWCVVADTTPPTVVPSFKSGADLSGAKTMVFTIKDNLAGIASYRVEIDGKWAIMEHHTIQNTLTHHFDDERFGKGKNHTVKVTLKDGSGNSTTITRNYFR